MDREEVLTEQLEIDLEGALRDNPLIARELDEKLQLDPTFLDWWDSDPVNDFIFESLREATIPNDYGEYNNYDFIIKSAWSKQKGIGKSTVALALKQYYDEAVTGNGFCFNEVFFTIDEKLAYLKENAGKLHNRFFVLDEVVPLIGQSSTTNTLKMLRIDDTTRIHGYNNAYVSPRGENLFSHDYYIEVVFKDTVNKTVVCVFRARDSTPLGWIGVKRPKYSIWKKYQKKKKEFTRRLESDDMRKLQFEEVYEKLQERFDIEGRFQEELEYYKELNEWQAHKKGGKPVKPRVIVTPARIRNWLPAVKAEMTNQELDTGSEVIYSMLEKKFRGGEYR